MQRKELLAELESVRGQLEDLLADLSPAQFEEPSVPGGWSAKDVLAHITAWEVDALTNLGKVKRGVKPGHTRWTAAQIQAQNDSWHAEMKDRPLERVLADFRGARRQTRRLLEGMSDQEAQAPAAWLQGRSVVEYVAGHTANHEAEHLEHLRAWRAQRAGAPSNGKAAEEEERANGREPNA